MNLPILQDIIAVLGTCLDIISSGLFAIGLGFITAPMALGFLVVAAGMLIFRQVCPLSLQAQTLVYVSNLTKDRREQASIGLFSGLVFLFLGITGILGTALDYVGINIMQGVIAGAGIMLAGIGLKLYKEDHVTTLVSIVLGVTTYLLTSNLVYTILAGMIGATIVYNILNRQEIRNQPPLDPSAEKLRFCKPTFNLRVLRGVLVLCTFMLGGIISDANVTSSFAGITPDSNGLASYLGLGSAVSSIFGGPPMGFVVSGSAAAPDPILCGVAVMVILAGLFLWRIIPRLARYIPKTGMAGVLVTLGFFVMFPGNALSVLSYNTYVGTATILVTVFVDPFWGMIAGLLMRLLAGVL